jgi:hypothetical protein
MPQPLNSPRRSSGTSQAWRLRPGEAWAMRMPLLVIDASGSRSRVQQVEELAGSSTVTGPAELTTAMPGIRSGILPARRRLRMDHEQPQNSVDPREVSLPRCDFFPVAPSWRAWLKLGQFEVALTVFGVVLAHTPACFSSIEACVVIAC